MPDIEAKKADAPGIQTSASTNPLNEEYRELNLLAGGRRAVRFYVEEDAQGRMLLPALEGKKPVESLRSLREGFEALVEEVKNNPLNFKHTESRSEANLIITSKNLPDSYAVAITDISPSGQHRITFNTARSFDAALLESTAAHAFEISFGYPVQKYDAIEKDPYFK